MRAEVADQTDRWRLWAPIFFGGGCAAYFALRSEPAAWPLMVAAVLTGGAWLAGRRFGLARRWTLALLMLACLCGGAAVAKLRTEAVSGPIAPALAEPTVLEAWVIDVDSPGERGARIVVAPVRIRGLAPEATPVRLRATVPGEPPAPGVPVRLYGILNPPPAPASPGAYDFGRNAYFQGMGGTLFALGQTRPTVLPEPPWRVRLAMKINAARYALAQRIVARLGERTGGIAAAMTTGHETWIGREDLDAMRDSGLAHILSISGLHMAIVGGFVFFGVRLGMAAWPWLALRVSGKKVAAVAGLIAVGTYLMVSGAPPPAERAAITASIAFVAILLDRQAVTMHALAVAAFAMQHFNRTAVYGLIANLGTAPIADFILMPALALGAVLEPLGLGAPFLWLAGKGVDLMLAIGHWTAGLPGAVQTIAIAPAAALPVAFLGILFICLWRGRLRWLGLPLAAAVLIWPRPAAPDLWIGDGGTNAAWRQAEAAVVVRPGVRQFAADLWSRRRGLKLTPRPEAGWTCKRSFCAPETAGSGPIALWWGKKPPSAEQLDLMCRSASVVSSRAELASLPASCAGRLVLDGVDYARGGSVELWRVGAGWKAVWAADVRGQRPWTRQADPDFSDSGG
ncbi:ComEC/Rec2 family competence protein [Brevundimonas sp. NPDC090276]|uniref:ComEC/Rec2 family competence protein n=1 Tax=Brevundimonas sp. NPDC090276 TaxID=3363956 RepID=UPI00383A0EB2